MRRYKNEYIYTSNTSYFIYDWFKCNYIMIFNIILTEFLVKIYFFSEMRIFFENLFTYNQ